jgi:hypothetical protein
MVLYALVGTRLRQGWHHHRMLSHQRSCIGRKRSILGAVVVDIVIVCRTTVQRSIVVGLAGRMVQSGQGFLVSERVDRGRRIDKGFVRTAIQLRILIIVRRDVIPVAQVQARAVVVVGIVGIAVRLLAEHLEFCIALFLFYNRVILLLLFLTHQNRFELNRISSDFDL